MAGAGAGMLTFNVNCPGSGTSTTDFHLQISRPIPQSLIVLNNYYVNIVGGSTTNVYNCIYLGIQYLSVYKLIDELPDYTFIPLPVKNFVSQGAGVYISETQANNTCLLINLNGTIQRTTSLQLYYKDYSTSPPGFKLLSSVPGFTSVQAIFQFQLTETEN